MQERKNIALGQQLLVSRENWEFLANYFTGRRMVLD